MRNVHDWRAFFSGPALEPTDRAAMAQRVVSWLVVPLWFCTLTLFTLAIAFAVQVAGAEPHRFIPFGVWVSGLCCVTYLRARNRWMHAAVALACTLFCGTATAVLINSVHAPAYQSGFVLLALVLPLFGPRWAVVTIVAALSVGVLSLVLTHAGVFAPTRHPPGEVRIILYFVSNVMSLILLAGTYRLLGDALCDARGRQRDAEAARSAQVASDQALRTVFEQASVGMLLLTANGIVTRANRHAAAWLRSTEAELIGRNLENAQLGAPEQRRLLADAVAAVEQQGHSRHELTVRGELGAQSVYQVSVSKFAVSPGEPSHVMFEVVDVTDLVRTRAMLAQARRLEALGMLSGGVAHDINNMLAAISGACDLSDAAFADSRSVGESHEIIRQAVARASALTRQLLAFGRQDHIEPVPLDLNQMVTEVGILLARTLRKNIDVNVALCAQPVGICGDAAALENALLNLALNAQDAMPDGGTLTVSTDVVEADEAQRLGLVTDAPPGPLAMIRVQDTGTGMSAAVRERLFDPFFTTKALGKGTGLGLAAVHGTVTNHKGAINVYSTLGLGSTFELYVPATCAPPSRAPTAAHLEGPRLNARVLLADDERLVRSTLSAVLRAAGCEVQGVDSGESLVSLLSTGTAPDIIISDLMMPGLCGRSLVRTLLATRGACPLLLITGFTGDDVSAELPIDGSCRLLRKPFGNDELLRVLGQLLGARPALGVGNQGA